MACFLVPMGEAIVVSTLQKVIEKREEKASKARIEKGLKWSQRLSWLNKLLWGGVILLTVEHIWHGEIVPWPPFLTAMQTPEETTALLHELSTLGVAMAIAVTAVWGIILLVAELTRVKARVMPEIKST